MKNKKINWDWTPTKKIEKYYSNNFYKIFSFFILHCPIKNTSKMAKDFNERNISSISLCNMIKKELDNWETSQVNEIENLLKEKMFLNQLKLFITLLIIQSIFLIRMIQRNQFVLKQRASFIRLDAQCPMEIFQYIPTIKRNFICFKTLEPVKNKKAK